MGIQSAVRDTILFRDHHTCRYCKRQGDGLDPDGRTWHIDHVIPVTKGGTDDPENLALSCQTCNLQKRDHIGWAREPDPIKINGGVTLDGDELRKRTVKGPVGARGYLFCPKSWIGRRVAIILLPENGKA
jgi:hypothetical protein